MSEHTGSLTRSSDFLHRAYRAAVVPGIISYFSSNLALLADGILVGRRVGMDGLASVGMSQPMLLAATLTGVTALIFVARGDVRDGTAAFVLAGHALLRVRDLYREWCGIVVPRDA